MIKLITQIKRWIEQEAKQTHPELQIQDHKEINNGEYYEFQYQKFNFSLIILDLKDQPKASWFFHKDFDQDEKSYWQGKYEFKLAGLDNYTKSVIQIEDIKNNLPVRTIMSRKIPTMRIFTKDLKWILVMGKKGETQ